MKDTATRRPNRFLADLTQAMRVTAEQARQATIDQFQSDAKSYVEQLHARSADEAVELRNRAEQDVTSIREWSKAEMERIRIETEQRTTRRKEALEQELQDYAAGIELQVERVQQQVRTFEEEMSQFFEMLLQESDPTVFASMAAQMPEAPMLAEPDREELAEELRVRRETMAQTEPMPPVEEQESGNGQNGQGGPAVEDSEAEMAEEAVNARLGAIGQSNPAAYQAPQAVPSSSAGRDSSQVVVVGLVSVASIATFKRQLGRLPGVKSVGVSSGPDGEFIFTVGHTQETSLGTLIPTLPAFQARVVNEHDGVLNVSAHDPEAEG